MSVRILTFVKFYGHSRRIALHFEEPSGVFGYGLLPQKTPVFYNFQVGAFSTFAVAKIAKEQVRRFFLNPF